MKLCALTQSYAPTSGGVRTLVHAQRDWCVRHGIEHVLIVPGERDGVDRDGLLTTHTVASPRMPGSPVYRLLLRSDKVLRILQGEMPDVVEVHCAYNLPWTALLHRRRHGGLVTAFFNTDVATAYVEAPLARRAGRAVGRTARALTERYLRSLYNRCDVVVGISPAMHQRLGAIGVRGAVHIPLGVDLDTFSPERRDPALRTELGVAADELLLVYAGRLDREKRPDIVLEAFARLPADFGAVLVLAGDGPLRASLEQRAAEVGRAHVLPFIADRGELARLYASADVYVSAHGHETFGLSVVEAQACGLPVVGVRGGAMIDRVRPETGILVKPESPAALAAAIADTPRDSWKPMGERARERVREKFSWDRTFDTLLDIYRARR